jgi:hypothetical protein
MNVKSIWEESKEELWEETGGKDWISDNPQCKHDGKKM